MLRFWSFCAAVKNFIATAGAELPPTRTQLPLERRRSIDQKPSDPPPPCPKKPSEQLAVILDDDEQKVQQKTGETDPRQMMSEST